jgi:mono/diheme cytochrome c family protein
VLSTAGDLVFEGTADGHFEAYRSDTGARLWSFDAQTGVMAGPVTYTVNGEQYIAVLAGWGGVFPLATGEVSFKSGRVRNVSRMLAFKLRGKASLPPLPEVEQPVLHPPASTASAAQVQRGEKVFQRYCAACHGDDLKGNIPAPYPFTERSPDLTTLARRHGGTFPDDYIEDVLRHGVMIPAHGPPEMPNWGEDFRADERLNEAQVTQRITNLKNYIKSLQAK